MDDERILLSFAEGRISKCINQYIVTTTNFLDINQQSLLLSRFSKETDAKIVLFGGYSNAERAIAVFLPNYIEVQTSEDLLQHFIENPEDNPVTALRIKKDNFSSIGHRDYLGALMGLGIKREMIGDIIVSDSGADLIAMKSIVPYVKNELISAGRASLKVSEISLNELSSVSQDVKQAEINVVSMRLDSIVSSCFKLSRSSAVNAIVSGSVFVNSCQVTKCDKKVSLGDKIVFRSKGKVVLKEQTGTSKKGRNFIKIDIYL